MRLAAPVALDAGAHELRLQVREQGLAIDRLVLTTDAAFRPS